MTVLLYLYNHLTFVISTRNSWDYIITLLVIFILLLIELDLYYIGVVIYGLAAHFKIYNNICTCTLFLYYSKGNNNDNIGRHNITTKINNS